MKTYPDTGFLVSLHTSDGNTRHAARRMKTQPLPLPWTWLHDVEFRNALRLRVFRSEMTRDQCHRVLTKVAAWTTSGVYAGASPSLSLTASEAERLSAAYSEQIGTRTLDVLHVAQAVVLGMKVFLTFDHRQAALARAAGFKVPPLSSGP